MRFLEDRCKFFELSRLRCIFTPDQYRRGRRKTRPLAAAAAVPSLDPRGNMWRGDEGQTGSGPHLDPPGLVLLSATARRPRGGGGGGVGESGHDAADSLPARAGRRTPKRKNVGNWQVDCTRPTYPVYSLVLRGPHGAQPSSRIYLTSEQFRLN